MELVNRIAQNLKICLKNKIEEDAIKNIFFAKMAHLFALKNVTFVSTNNLAAPALLSYYAVNFINSGGQKNETVKHVDNFLIPFIQDEYNKINKEVAQEELDYELSYLSPDAKNYAQEKNKLIKKYNEEEILSFKTNGGTPASIYDKIEKIYKYKKGALFAQITEFSDYFRGSVENPTSSNKSFLDLLNNLYDGKFESNDSMSTKRKELNNIPFSLLFLSDIEELLEPKNNKTFKMRLKTGLARRINFYINKNINYSKNPPERPTIEQKRQAYSNLSYISKELKEIYDNLPFDTQFVFTEEANELIEAWEEACSDEVAKFYKYVDMLTLDETIKRLEIEHSPWKISKLAVIIQILLNQHTSSVTSEAVMLAIDFYTKCRESLYSILDQKQITEEEQLYNFFLNNQNVEFNRTDIKKQNFVSRDNFSRWFSVAIKEVSGLLENNGYELTEFKKSRNEYRYICSKIKDPEDDLIHVSVSNSKEAHPAHEYEYKEVTTDEFKTLIKEYKGLSAGRFKDGHRKIKNKIGSQNTIWLDFDENKTIDEAKEEFKEYWYIIYTTPSHQKQKGSHKPCDRFRVILKTKYPMPTDEEQYISVMSNIAKKYGSDKACSDFSRYYKGNPNAEIFTNKGKYFDWQEFDTNTPQKYKRKTCETQKEDIWQSGVYENSGGLTNENIFTSKGDEILKTNDITDGNRDNALKYTVGVLIAAVQDGKLSHHNALQWLENKLNEITTPDFKYNANKYMKRLERLRF